MIETSISQKIKISILIASLIALSSAAKYDGKGAADARRILNESQGVAIIWP